MGDYKYLTIVLSSSLRARVLTLISRIAPALPSPGDFFCALRPKRTNESTRILIHINSCLVRALVILPTLCKGTPTQIYDTIFGVGLLGWDFPYGRENGHILGNLMTMLADVALHGNVSRSRTWRLEAILQFKGTIHFARMNGFWCSAQPMGGTWRACNDVCIEQRRLVEYLLTCPHDVSTAVQHGLQRADIAQAREAFTVGRQIPGSPRDRPEVQQMDSLPGS